MARMSKALREARAILDAQKRLEARIDRIGWEEDTMYPLLEKVKSGELKIDYTPTVPRELGAGDAG
jgi:hypothetical protein